MTLTRSYRQFRCSRCGRCVANLQSRVDERATIAQYLKTGVLEVPEVVVAANIERGSETRKRKSVQPVYLEELTDDRATKFSLPDPFSRKNPLPRGVMCASKSPAPSRHSWIEAACPVIPRTSKAGDPAEVLMIESFVFLSAPILAGVRMSAPPLPWVEA